MSMKSRALLRILGQNLSRNTRHLIFSAFGIVIGIASFVFFWGLSAGVSRVLLHDIFPIDRVEVISPKTSFTGLGSAVLDDRWQPVTKLILARAKQVEADVLLTVAKAGRLAGLIGGSVTRQVLRAASVPVLVIK